MSEIIKNKKDSSETLIIGHQKFDADREGVFNLALDEVKNILIKELPLARKCLILNGATFEQLNSPIVVVTPDEMDLIFERQSNNVVEVTFVEEWELSRWPFQITQKYYYILKELVLDTASSLKTQVIHNVVGRGGHVHFEFTIELVGLTISSVYEEAIKINKSVDDRIAHAIEKGENCIRMVLEGAFHIDVSKFFSGKDKNSTV